MAIPGELGKWVVLPIPYVKIRTENKKIIPLLSFATTDKEKR
jgi:hypothetical protein